MNDFMLNHLVFGGIVGICCICCAQAIPEWFAKGPTLGAPEGQVIRVANTEELIAAVEHVTPGGTILLSDGQYQVRHPIVLDQKKNIVIRSVAGDATKVRLTGIGWERGTQSG